MPRSRPAVRRGAPRRNLQVRPPVARSSPAAAAATRPAAPSRAAPCGSPKYSRASRRSNSRRGEVLRFPPRRACVWRDPAIRDRRGTGRRIHRGSERSGTHPRCRLRPARTLSRRLRPERGSMSPSTNFLLPGSTMSRVPPSRRNRGSFIPSSGMLTSPPSRTSLMSRSCGGFLDRALHQRLGTAQETAGGFPGSCCPDSGA